MSAKLDPVTGSPPMPTQLDWPIPRARSWPTASYIRVPERETTPTRPGEKMEPGMIPALALSGLMIPGQFGPMSRARG